MNTQVSLDEVLRRELKPVSAPDQLWFRIQRELEAPVSRVPVGVGWAWAIAIVFVIVSMTAWSFRAKGASVPEYRSVFAALSIPSDQLDFPSDNAAQLRDWVRSNAGLEMTGFSPPASHVQFVGASSPSARLPSAAVVYRIENHDAVLLVSKSKGRAKAEGHSNWTDAQQPGVRISSWTRGDETFRLAYAEQLALAAVCTVCHVDAKQLTMRN